MRYLHLLTIIIILGSCDRSHNDYADNNENKSILIYSDTYNSNHRIVLDIKTKSGAGIAYMPIQNNVNDNTDSAVSWKQKCIKYFPALKTLDYLTNKADKNTAYEYFGVVYGTIIYPRNYAADNANKCKYYIDTLYNYLDHIKTDSTEWIILGKY